MIELIIEIVIGIGMSILVAMMVFVIIIFIKYKKIKLTENPNFDYSQYQFKAGSTYFIYPVHIKEKDSNPKLIRLKTIYNKSITVWRTFIIVFLLIALTLIAISNL